MEKNIKGEAAYLGYLAAGFMDEDKTIIKEASVPSEETKTKGRRGFVPYFLKVGNARNKKRRKITPNLIEVFEKPIEHPVSESDIRSEAEITEETITLKKSVKRRTRKKKNTFPDDPFDSISLDERRKIFRDVDKICNNFDTDEKNEPIKESYAIFRDEALKYRLLSGAEEKALAKRIEEGDEEAGRLLVNSNLRLVIACTKQIYGHNKNTTILDFMDLIQEGILGLIVAVKKFDWRRNTRFSTCAVPWIYQHIVRAADSQREGFSVPGYAGFSIRSMNNDIRKYVEGKLDVSKESPTRLKRIKELAAVMAPIIAIDNKEEPDETPGVLTPEAIADDSYGADDIVNNLQIQNYKAALHEKLRRILTPQEYLVLCRRYGMGEYEDVGAAPLRLISEEIGKSIEYTRILLGQIEMKIRNNKDAETVANKWFHDKDVYL